MRQSAEERPTATDLLANPWVQGEKTAKHSMVEVAHHLREFNARRKFKVRSKFMFHRRYNWYNLFSGLLYFFRFFD